MIVGRAERDAAAAVPLVARPALVRALAQAVLIVAMAGLLSATFIRLDGRAPRALAMSPAGASTAPGGIDHGLEAAPAVLAQVVVAPPAAPPGTVEATTTTSRPPVRAAFPVGVLAAEALVAKAPGTVEGIIADVFGARASSAIAVARCESGLRPGAISAGQGNWGLFQINRVHEDLVEEMGYQWDDLLDARVNSLVAKEVFDAAGGWSPWECAWAAG